MGLGMIWLIVSPGLRSGTYQEQEKGRADLAKAVAEAKVSLEQGLSAATREGKPISAKFEMEENKLQLSVYTTKGDKFSEVMVDHNTGTVAKAEPITTGEDYTAAKDQNAAMAKAKRSLRAALAQVVKGNPGFRAVSIFPALKDGHPVAEVALVKGDQWKTVSAKLD
jgi:hypothetical protein